MYEEFDFSFWTVKPEGTELMIPCCDENPSVENVSMIGSTVSGVMELTMAGIEFSNKREKTIEIVPCRHDPLAQVLVTGQYTGIEQYRKLDNLYIDSLIPVLCWPELNETPRTLEVGDWVTLKGTFVLDLDE